MIKPLAEILFYGLTLLFLLYSLLMIYVLLRFGQSRTLGLIVSLLYLVVVFSLFAAAQNSLAAIQFEILS